MTSLKDCNDVTDGDDRRKDKDAELPPSGTSLHKRRRGEPPATLSVKPSTPSDAEGSSPCTAGPTSEEYWNHDGEVIDAETLCDTMLQRLKDKDDPVSKRGKDVAVKTKETMEILDQLEKLLELLDQFVNLKEQHGKLLKRLRDVNYLKRLHNAHKRIDQENFRLRSETKEIEQINQAFDAAIESEFGQAIFDSMMSSGRTMKRSGSKWMRSGSHRFGGSLLRKQRSRSAGGDDSDAPLGPPLRRRSEGVFNKEVEKAKVSKWTRVKAAFKWEKAQWQATSGTAGAVAAGALVGAVALAGSSPAPSLPTSPTGEAPGLSRSAPGLLSGPGLSGSSPGPGPELLRDSTSLTPGSALSLTPDSSCEELRIESGTRKNILRCDENDNTFLHAPTQDDSSTSPSPNKLHKSPWGKMRDIIQSQTKRESIKKKTRPSKSSPDVVPVRRRSFSDGGDSDAPPVLTLTIPSSEELESDPHPLLRKQRSLELGARPPQHRTPRVSKWSKVKKAFLTSASASMPSSPSRHSAFFTDAGKCLIGRRSSDTGPQGLPSDPRSRRCS
ncbi:hypothetical protein O0L34_g16934 [Tuta absoluta]|nr:hypothetical protein O0L34_g16934 [Tuta absoluta]